MAKRKKAPELTFQQHIADYLIREHKYGVLEQADITDTEHFIAEDQLWAFLNATQADTLKKLTDMTPFKDITIDNKLLFVQKPVIAWKSTMQPKEQTTDYQNAMWAAEWLTDSAEQKTPVPFFLACGIFRPHLPWTVPAEYYARFDLKTTQLPPIDEDDFSDIHGGGPSEEYIYAKEHKIPSHHVIVCRAQSANRTLALYRQTERTRGIVRSRQGPAGMDKPGRGSGIRGGQERASAAPSETLTRR